MVTLRKLKVLKNLFTVAVCVQSCEEFGPHACEHQCINKNEIAFDFVDKYVIII